MKPQTTRRIYWALAIFLTWAAVAEPGRADERSAADLLPATTVLYAELNDPQAWLDVALEHPLREKIQSLEGVRQALAGKQYLQLKAVVSVIEAQLGRPWPQLLAAAAGGGVAMGVDAKTEGFALVVKSRDDTTLEQLVTTLVKLTRQDAQDKGNPDPIKTGEYRGITAYEVGNAKLAPFGHWLLATNKPELGKLVLDSYLDQGGSSLAGNEQFRLAKSRSSAEAAAWAYVDTGVLREAGVAKELFRGQADNPLGELLVGGILSTLQKTPYATAALTAAQQRLRLSLAAPHDPQWVAEEREYFFGPDGKGVAPPVLTADNTVFSLSAFRNVSEMWLRAGDLFNERMVDQLDQADSNLSTLFGGKDFGEDILGTVKPEVQLVVARQLFQAGQPQPAIKLPAFGLAFELKDPESMRPELRRTFQSLIGFLNVVGAMNGQPQLDLDMEKEGDRQIISGTYLAGDEENLDRLRINFNFSPSVAFVGDRLIVASTKQLAGELAGLTADQPAKSPSVNTRAVADMQVLRDILSDNRGQLIAQNMLAEGHSKEEAEREIETLLMLLGLLDNASLQLATADGQLELALEIGIEETE